MPQADGGLGPHRTHQGNKRGAYYSGDTNSLERMFLFGCNLFDLGSVLSVSLQVILMYASAEEGERPGG